MKEKACYQLMLSKNFSKTHLFAGKETGFEFLVKSKSKIHTIRENYDWWENRFKKIEQDEAYLCVREWIGKPYKSKHRKLFEFHKSDGIGLEKIFYIPERLQIVTGGLHHIENQTIAKNDGLGLSAFYSWFKNVEKSKPLAVIHFTDFRYANK